MRELIAADFFAALELGRTVVLIHQCNHINRDLFRACCRALAVIGARAKVFIHFFDHRFGALEALWLTLGQTIEVGDLAPVNKLAAPFGHAATHAPQPMH